ncbi:MAG: hypothetical protein RLZZ416_759 [Candidatus Parcubacteria bacterium]|jgi:type IV secretory pathway component VirB8
MEETELQRRLDAIEQKIDATHAAAEKSRRYILWMLIISIVVVVLPLIGLFFAVPTFLSTYGEALNMQ